MKNPLKQDLRYLVLIECSNPVQKTDNSNHTWDYQPGGVETKPAEIETDLLSEVPSEKRTRSAACQVGLVF